MSESKIRLTFPHQNYYRETAVQPATAGRWRFASEMKKVLYCIVGFSRTDAQTIIERDPLQFVPYVDQIEMRVNGMCFPNEPYVNCSSQLPNRVLSDAYELGSKLGQNKQDGSLLSVDSWQKHTAVFAFDLSKIPSTVFKGDGSICDCELRWTMDPAGKQAFDIHVLLVNEREVEIDLLESQIKWKSL